MNKIEKLDNNQLFYISGGLLTGEFAQVTVGFILGALIRFLTVRCYNSIINHQEDENIPMVEENFVEHIGDRRLIRELYAYAG